LYGGASNSTTVNERETLFLFITHVT